MILLSVILLLASSVEAQVFTPGGRYGTGASSRVMVAADLDNDGDLGATFNQADEDVVYIHLNGKSQWRSACTSTGSGQEIMSRRGRCC